ncbi:MAG: DedA family protein [Proteobacteria bacterium]|nr:DedA family protein [Pseudomonadota bacterium]
MDALMAHAGLALSAFTSATLLPGTSEVTLLAAAARWPGLIATLFPVATLFNVLGSLVNWWLGRNAVRFAGRRWFPVSVAQIETAQKRFGAYGPWALLLSWVPVIGDPLTVAAGVLKVPLATFLAIVTLAKGARYAALLAGLTVLS